MRAVDWIVFGQAIVSYVGWMFANHTTRKANQTTRRGLDLIETLADDYRTLAFDYERLAERLKAEREA